MINLSQWQSFKNIINKAHDSFNQDVVLWKRFTRSYQRYGEDVVGKDYFDDVSLNCLISFNVFRTWPISDETTSGVLDKENMVMILNKNYLDENGYLNDNGFFDMDPGKDYFIHMGIEYRSAGEIPVAQAHDENLLFYIILKRRETKTSGDKY